MHSAFLLVVAISEEGRVFGARLPSDRDISRANRGPIVKELLASEAVVFGVEAVIVVGLPNSGQHRLLVVFGRRLVLLLQLEFLVEIHELLKLLLQLSLALLTADR